MKHYTYTLADRVWAANVKKHYQRCALCGRLTTLQAHHWFKARSCASLRYCSLNGIGLCGSCHVRIHSRAFGIDYLRLAMTVMLVNRFKSIESLINRLTEIERGSRRE